MNQRKIYIIYHGRFPSEKAAALFAAKTAESFVGLGCNVELIIPTRDSFKVDPFEYYSLKQRFKITKIYIPDIIKFNIFKSLSFRLSHLLFALSVRKYLTRNASARDIFYSNEFVSLLLVPKAETVCYELHDYPENNLWLYKKLFHKVSHVLVTNSWKQKKLHKDFPETINKTFVEMNAVDIDDFNINISTHEARTQLNLSHEKKIILYTGHLYSWKGVETLATAASKFSEDILFYFVGGTLEDVERFRAAYKASKNVFFVGHFPHDQMPIWQKAADILVIPNSGKQNISVYYTSPMKLFEYLASDRPIIASDLPSIREIAGDFPVYFTPDSASDLEQVIKTVLNEGWSVDKQKIREFINNHSWLNRGKRILARLMV